MSQTASDQSGAVTDRHDAETDEDDAADIPEDAATTDTAADEETPDIKEDLISEELRIDGICGVY